MQQNFLKTYEVNKLILSSILGRQSQIFILIKNIIIIQSNKSKTILFFSRNNIIEVSLKGMKKGKKMQLQMLLIIT